MTIERADERGHLAAAPDASEAALRILESGRDPAHEHRTVAPATDVARLVDLTAMDERRPAAVLADRFAQARPAVDDEERRAVEVESTLPKIAQQRLAHGRVFRGALAEREHVLLPVGRDSQGQEDH